MAFEKLRNLLEKSKLEDWTEEDHNTLPKVLEALDLAMQALVDVDTCEIGVHNTVNGIARRAIAKIKELSGDE